MEYTIVEIETFKWEAIKNELQLTPDVDYTLKRIRIKDDLFKDDQTHELLKKTADKAYKKLQEYEFNIRHNIK